MKQIGRKESTKNEEGIVAKKEPSENKEEAIKQNTLSTAVCPTSPSDMVTVVVDDESVSVP